MAASDGVITQKDIIEDKALTIGSQYAKNMEIAIQSNKEFVESLKVINKLAQEFKGAKTNSEYITLKQQQTLETQKAIDALKKQEVAEIAMQKIEAATLATQKKKLELSDKEAASKKRNTKLTVEERIQNEIANRVLKQETLERLGLVGAYTKLNAKRTEAKKTLLDLLAAEKQDIAAIKEATKAFDALDKRVRAADQAVGDFHKSVGNYPTLKGFTSSLKDLAGAFGLVGGITAFAATLKDAFNTINTFEQGLADLSAITGASGKDLDYLKQNAIELGKGVKGGAIAVVEAYKLIAGAKPELLDNVQALNKVTDAAITLSQAAGIELPDAATRLTDAMNQFGVGADSAQEFIDALANGAKFGSAEIPQLTEAMLKFGAVARSTNISVQESAALVELLAENGLKGADAGTALRNVLLKISAPDALPKEAQRSLRELGISFDLLKNKTVPIQQKFEALKPLLVDNGKLLKAFGFENVVAAQNIIEHTDRLAELTVQMNTFGTAEEQAAIRMETVNGKTEKLKSTYDSLILSIGNGKGVISAFFKFWIDGAAGALKGLERLNDSWEQLEKKAAARGERIGEKAFEDRMHRIGFITTSDSEKALTILKMSLTAYQRLKKDFDAKTKEITGLEEAGFSTKVARREREQLVFHLAAQLAIIKASKRKLNAINNPKGGEEQPTISAGPTDQDIKDALKRAKELNDALYELERQRLERLIKINAEIADDQKLKDDIRIKAVENVNKTEIELANLTKQHKLDADKFVLEEDKMNANQRLFIEREAANKIVDVNNKAQKDIEKIREFDEASYQKSLEKRISRINESMNKELELENIRFKELGDLESMKQSDREKLIEAHEKRVFEIKKKAALASLRAQADTLDGELKASDALPEKERLTAEKRQEIAEKLSKAKLDISEKELEKYDENGKKIVETEEITAQDIIRIHEDLTSALSNLANAIFERKMQNIEVEIDKNNEFYDKQIELAGENEAQKELLEKERDKKNELLQKKLRKEQEKQAKFEKALAISKATLMLGVAVNTALTAGPGIGIALAAITAAIAGAQLAAVIATPIPKYKMGRKGGKKEIAMINDGGVPEVVESKDGTAKIYQGQNRVVQLQEHDNVYKNVEEYTKSQRKKLLNGVNDEAHKLNEFQKIVIVKEDNRELMGKIDKLIAVTQRNKPKSSKQSNPDLSHALWKLKQQL